MTTPDPIEPVDVYSEDGYFAVIPEWVLDAEIGAQAVRLYAVLRRYADQRREAHPSRKTLASRLQVSDVKVVDRALADLERIGAVEVFGRWRNEAGEIVYTPDDDHRERSSNGYRLRRAPRGIGGGGGGRNATTPRSQRPHPGGRNATRVGVEKGEERKPGNESQGNERGVAGSGRGARVSRGPAAAPPPQTTPAAPVAALAAAPPASGADPDDPEPPTRCGVHRAAPAAGPCPGCGDARREHGSWEARAATRARARDAAARAAAAEARQLARAEVASCRLCDEHGNVSVAAGIVRCTHDPSTTTGQGRTEFLAAKQKLWPTAPEQSQAG